MSGDMLQDVARLVEDVARNTPGVTGLFRPGTLMGNVIAAAAQVAAGTDAPTLVEVTRRDDGLHVTIAIGVVAAAADTSRAVHDALHDALGGAGYPDAVIHLTVAQIAA